MTASAFIVTLPTESGHTERNNCNTIVCWANTGSEAITLAGANFAGDSNWANATATAIVATDFSGYRFRVKIDGSTPDTPYLDVSVNGDATNKTPDLLAGLMVTALNATGKVANAAYNSSTNVLSVAGAADGIGNKTFAIEFYPPGSETAVTSMFSSLVMGGSAGSALTATLPADAYTPPVVFATCRKTT